MMLIAMLPESQIQDYVREIINHIGDDTDREGLRETPRRVVDSYKELFRGYDPENFPRMTCFTEPKQRGMILDKGHFFSMCEHHMLPFFGDYYFAYIADRKWIGASKIGRLIDYHSAKLQTAERLSIEVMNDFMEIVSPHGAILLMSGRHLCKEMRGVKKYNSPFEVIEARGIFLNNKGGCKDEFIGRIGSRL